METVIKRAAAFLLAACVVLVGMGKLSSTAYAAEPKGSYVLQYDERQPYLYGSCYECKHSYCDPDTDSDSALTDWNTPKIYNLVCEGDDGNHSIAAYCAGVDADTVENGNIYYRRMNLEDATYFDVGAAARIRAIVLHTFPYLSVETVAANVNRTMGAETVMQLTQGEVISAAQQAIWEIAHAEKYNVDQNYVGIRGQSGYDRSKFVYPESLDGCVESEFTAANIQQLYQYFLNLPGQAANFDVISEFSFRDIVYNASREEDGTYMITVAYTVDASLREEDNLSMTVVCGSKANQESLKIGAQTVTFTGMTEKLPVTLTISGTQTGGDVYLFDAEGGRTAAQSMVGYDDTTLPVLTQVIAAPDREINIYKTISDGESKRPLVNIEFDIYLAATMDDLRAGKMKLNEKPTKAEIATCVSQNPLITLRTDAQGLATYNLTANGHPDGVYLVVEKENDMVLCPAEPFFVSIPSIDEEGEAHIYAVTVHPKNTVEVRPEIRMDITQIGRNKDTFHINALHTWIIQSDIPAGICDAAKYVISDSLDYRLKLKHGFEVKVGLKNCRAGEESVTLIPGTDYSVTTTKAFDEQNRAVDVFTVSLTTAGVAAVTQTAPAKSDYEIRVYFDAVIDSDALLGKDIPNQAELRYINSAGTTFEACSDVPVVSTGGIGVLNLDSATDYPLQNASFMIAREALNSEIAAGQSVPLTVGEEEKQVIFEAFYTDEETTAHVREVTSSEEGRIMIRGLAYGEYYILETQAPQGYNLLMEPVVVEIDADSHLEEKIVKVYNTKFLLPETGGIGTRIFTIIGVICIGSAFVLSACCLWKKENRFDDGQG